MALCGVGIQVGVDQRAVDQLWEIFKEDGLGRLGRDLPALCRQVDGAANLDVVLRDPAGGAFEDLLTADIDGELGRPPRARAAFRMASSHRRAMKSSSAIFAGRDAHNEGGNLASAWSMRTRSGDGTPGGSTITRSTYNANRSNRYSPSSAWYA